MTEEMILVCIEASDPTPFKDNAFSKCADCGVIVQHRPWVTAHLTKLCMPCAGKRVAADPNPEVTIDPRSIEEIRRLK